MCLYNTNDKWWEGTFKNIKSYANVKRGCPSSSLYLQKVYIDILDPFPSIFGFTDRKMNVLSLMTISLHIFCK